MKLASFFVVSFALHGVILILPISSFEHKSEKVVPVTFLLEQANEVKSKPPARVAKREPEQRRVRRPSKQPNPKPQSERNDERQDITDVAVAKKTLVPQPVQEAPPIRSSVQKPVESISRPEELSNKAPVPPEQAKERQTIDLVPVPKPLDQSDQAEDPSINSQTAQLPEAPFLQARYAYNPKPSYPDKAKREGWQGTVLLRVLINSRGEPAAIEVNHSSGFDVLDQAALRTVRRWRFHPAHRGDHGVESWVKIPIVFRLADAKN